jgi:hypothetical protein
MVAFGVLVLLGAMLSLPVIAWLMGLDGSVRHVYIDRVPAEGEGAYILTRQGVMQLYPWYIRWSELPDEAPVLDTASITGFAIAQKQFGPLDDYQLFRLNNGQRIDWVVANQREKQLFLDSGPLSPGDYMLVVQTDDMYGGQTYHYFQLR